MKKSETGLLTETFEIKGKWFLPETTLDQGGVAGVLRYSPDHILLDLFNTLNRFSPLRTSPLSSHPRINGYSESGEWITLFNCVPRNFHLNAPGFDTIAYQINHFYIGTELIEDEGIEMPVKASFSFLNLDAWLDYNIISYSYTQELGKAECVIDLNTSTPERKQLHIPAIGMTLCEEAGYRLEPPKDFFLNERTEIIVHRFFRLTGIDNQSTSFQRLTDYLHQLQHLFTLLIGKAMFFSYINFSVPDAKRDIRSKTAHTTDRHFRLFYNQAGDMTRIPHLSRNKPFSILIKRKDIKDEMESILNNWFGHQEKFKEIITAYISDLYLPTHPENKFLNIVKGLETFHRCYFEETSNESLNLDLDSERSKLLAFIREEVSEEVQDYFISRVNYREEKATLRQRIKYLLDVAPPQLTEQIIRKSPVSNKRDLIAVTIDTRNYYTHRDNRDKYPNVLKSSLDLRQVSKGLAYLLQFFCLTQIGIDSEIVVKRLLEHF